jgi:uncharacterized protein YneF (UPF0154 family)
MNRSLSHSILLMFLYLTVGSAIGAFVVVKYFPRIEVQEIVKELPQPDMDPCFTPDPSKG